MARPLALAAALAASLLAFSGAGGAATQQTPKRGGTVVVAQPTDEPACLNPLTFELCTPGTATFTFQSILGRVLEAPFDVGPDFTWRPRLVSSFEFTQKPPFSLTLHIRPEARWSDGTPITAADFVFTHQAIVSTPSADLHDDHRKEIRRVRAVDAKTVTVVLRSRFASWRDLFMWILPRHALRGEDLGAVWKDTIDNPKTGTPIGSGPFLVERWERGERLTLRRNPRFWGRHAAYVDRLVSRFAVESGDLVDGFRGGLLDVVAGYPSSFFAAVREVPGVRARAFPAVGWDHFEIRIGSGGHLALRNKLVRRALAFGIDRAALVEAAYAGLRPLGPQRHSVVFPTSSPYYRPNWQSYRYRPAEARRLLEQAGCRRGGDGVYRCTGARLSLRFVTLNIPGDYRSRVIALVQAQLRRAGVEVVPEFASSSALFGQILPGGAFDVALFAWVPRAPSPQLNGIYTCEGGTNYSGYCQRLVTRDLDQAERIFDMRQQARVLNRADAQMARDVPAIPLFERPQWEAVRSTVRNVGPFARDPLVNAENWWLDD